MSDTKRQAVADYVRALFRVGDGESLRVLEETTVADTCWREILFDCPGWRKPVPIYLSPEQRFITASLADLTRAPVAISKSRAAARESLLLREPSPSKGSQSAAVTLVEFADFQCPFCRDLNGFLEALPPDLKAQVRVIFKHLPVPGHSWAREAAKWSICAAAQSTEAFWKAHDTLLSAQLGIGDAEGMTVSLNRSFLGYTALSLTALASCLQSGNPDKTLDRDEALARRLDVHATPTVFINGVRQPPFSDAQDLSDAVRRALFEAAAERDGNLNQAK